MNLAVFTFFSQGAAPSVGATLCSVLVNLAAQEGFRGQFAESFSTKTTEGGGRRDVTPASVLVLVAGITKARNLTRAIILERFGCCSPHQIPKPCLDQKRAESIIV